MRSRQRPVSFSLAGGDPFHAAVKKRVEGYFTERRLSKHANGAMFFKTACYLGAFFTLYAMILGNVASPPVLLLCAAALGLVHAGIGFNIAHDAAHGAFSKHEWVNSLMAQSFGLVGGFDYTWILAHNLNHHTYTNIPNVDRDLRPVPWLRFHPQAPLRGVHRYQHLYAWFLYGMTSLVWIFRKDYSQLRDPELRPANGHTARHAWRLGLQKAGYYFAFIALPLIVLPLPFWQVALGFLVMHFAMGVALAIVFQLAHVVEGPAFPLPDSDGRIPEGWSAHQLRTTSDFGRPGRAGLTTWFCGGLDFQVVHHLFPRICHIHYPQLAPIVEATAREHGLPYHRNASFPAAVASHFRTLRRLGQPPEPIKSIDDPAPTSPAVSAVNARTRWSSSGHSESGSA